MNRFIRAHGYEAGPTQRPLTAGILAAAVAEVPTLFLLWQTGTIEPLSRAADLSLQQGTLAHIALVLIAGAIYGQVFQRAANDRSGSWLFGLSYGYIGWMLGPVTILQWLKGEAVVSGIPAQIVLGAYLLWGLFVGLFYPVLQRLLQAGVEDVNVRGRWRGSRRAG